MSPKVKDFGVHVFTSTMNGRAVLSLPCCFALPCHGAGCLHGLGMEVEWCANLVAAVIVYLPLLSRT